MKMPILISTLILSLLLSGCASVSPTPEPAVATPIIMPRLNPSPTLSNSSLPLTCQITDLNIYINETAGYCFAYPTRFTLGNQPSDDPEIQGPAVDYDNEPIRARLNIELTPATVNKSLQEHAEAYLKEFSGANPATFTWSQVSVANEPGLIAEPIPARLVYRIVFVQHHGIIFHLMYSPMDVPEIRSDLDELTQTILGSFAFTK